MRYEWRLTRAAQEEGGFTAFSDCASEDFCLGKGGVARTVIPRSSVESMWEQRVGRSRHRIECILRKESKPVIRQGRLEHPLWEFPERHRCCRRRNNPPLLSDECGRGLCLRMCHTRPCRSIVPQWPMPERWLRHRGSQI